MTNVISILQNRLELESRLFETQAINEKQSAFFLKKTKLLKTQLFQAGKDLRALHKY